MFLRRLLTNVSLWTALLAGLAGGLVLAVWSSPLPAFSYNRVSIISWRGGGDSIPGDAATAGWSGPMFYDTADQTTPAGRYPTGKWAPGDSFSRVLTVKNVDVGGTFALDRLQMRLRGDTQLAPRLAITVQSQGRLLYTGTLADFTGEATLALAEPLELQRGQRADLTFTVSLDRASDNFYQARSLQADIIVQATQRVFPIIIDVHPASWPNPINPGSPGTIPVAVNGSATLNVRTLVWQSARFGPSRAEPLRMSYEDWNQDGHTDLMLKFDNPASGFTCGMTVATLTISGQDGEVYEGSDPIVTPPCR